MTRLCVLLLACAALTALCAQPGAAAEAWRESYADAAEVARIYGAPEEEISADIARDLLVDLTNRTRRKAGLGKLKWSGPAERLASEHAHDMARRRYINHYDLEGRKCELRFNALGHTDNVMENIAYYEIDWPLRITPKLVERIFQHWLDSESHRANILEPAHTHMGCDIALRVHEGTAYVAAVSEFVADYGKAERLPARARSGETLLLEGKLDPQRARLRYVGLASEDLPFSRDPDYQNTHAGGYSPPLPVLALLPKAGALAGHGPLPKGVQFSSRSVEYNLDTGVYNTQINMPERWPAGSYYVTVWADSPAQPELGIFCISTQVVLVEGRSDQVVTKGMS